MLLKTITHLLRPALAHADKVDPDSLEEHFDTLVEKRQWTEAESLLKQEDARALPEHLYLALRAELLAYNKTFPEAEQLALAALQKQPGVPRPHFVLSLVYGATGRLEEALAQAINAYNLLPHKARICAQLGYCHVRLGHYDHARIALTQALMLDPEYVPAHNNMAIVCHARGEIAEARWHLDRALQIDPVYKPAQDNLSLMFPQPPEQISSFTPSTADRFDPPSGEKRSVEELEARFAQHPEDPATAIPLIEHYLKNYDAQSAHDVLEIALTHNPTSADLLCRAARLWASFALHARAEGLYRAALQIEPRNLDALTGLARVLKMATRFEEALPLLETAAEIDQTKNVLLALCSAQTHACRYREAMQTMDRLLSLYPDVGDTLLPYRATCHAYLGEFAKAHEELARAARIDPYNSSITAFQGTLHLLLGEYAQGWDGYRLRNIVQPERIRLLPYPLWQGEPLTDKEVLILAEQGLGDQIMFASCLPDLLAQRPKAIYLEVHSRLAALLVRSFPRVKVYASDQQAFSWLPSDAKPDCYLPIADLAWRFRRSEQDFPRHTGYLCADPERVAHWRRRLDSLGARPKIGFTWRGGVQLTRRTIRSLQLETLLPLLADPRFHFVNLQYGPVQEELSSFAASHGLSLTDWPEAIADLDDLAALISALDLVITVCNTTVHLAGALNRPCWVLTPFVPEWRYGAAHETMPWYPSVRLLRQPAFGDWSSVLATLRERLNGWSNDQA